MTKAFRICALLGLLSAGLLYIWWDEQDPWKRKARLETADRMSALQQIENRVLNWPPRVGEKFPEISLTDHNEAQFSLGSLKGKPTIVEIVAMSCAGCQAFSGGSKYGGFEGFPSQPGLDSIEQYLKSYGRGVELFGDKLNFVQIIIYNLNLKAPQKEQLRAWRKHFGLDKSNTYVLTGGEPLANKDSYKMIPGFLLLDSDLNVKYDSTGHTPRHDLFRELLPAVPRLLNPS